MNFMFAARLLDEGYVLTRNAWDQEGYIFKDHHGKIQFFDHNEPRMYEPLLEDVLADDWQETVKDCWMIVSVAYDPELFQDKHWVTYHICTRQNGRVSNNHVIDERDLPTWACCVDVDLIATAVHLHEQDVAEVRNVWSA